MIKGTEQLGYFPKGLGGNDHASNHLDEALGV
jgi:hypothetical protein